MDRKVTISKGNSKLGKVWNISLTPGRTCNGAPCLRECYAMKAFRMYPNVRDAWNGNTDAAETDIEGYFADIISAIRAARKAPALFRWHVAGDIPSAAYLANMVRVAVLFPRTRFLVFTKRHDLAASMPPAPRNLSVVLSAWPGRETVNPAGLPVAYYQDGTETVPADAFECPGRCDECGLCWNLDSGQSVVFMKH